MHKMLGSRIFKWLAILGSVFFILIIGLTLLLTYFFPSDLLRTELEVRGSEVLEGTVRIEDLSFNFLTGLRLKEVIVRKQNKRLIRIDRLNLDYSLIGLMRGHLTINEMLIDQADVSINLEELDPSVEVEKEVPPPMQPSEPAELPLLPLSLDLQTLAIKDSNFDLVISPTLALTMTQLNLGLSGSIDDTEAELNGSLQVADLNLDLEDKNMQLPLKLDFSFFANLLDQFLDLKELTIRSDPAVQLTLSGKIKNFLTKKEMDLSLHDVRLDLAKVLLIGKDFVPPELVKIQLRGTLSPEAEIKGSLPKSGLNGKVTLTVAGKKLEAELPAFQTSLHSTDFSIRAFDIRVNEGMPESGSLQMSLSNKKTVYQEYQVDEFQVQASGDYLAIGPVSGIVKVSGVSTIPPVGSLQRLTLPFGVELEGEGNSKSQDIVLKRLAVKLGDLLNLQARGEVHPQPSATDSLNVSFATRLEPHIEHLLPLIPQNFLEGITITKGAKPDVMTLKVTGTLNSDYSPSKAKLNAGVKLTDLTTRVDDLPASGTLKRGNVLISAVYDGQSGGVKGTVGTALKISDVHHGGTLGVGQFGVKLQSTIDATLTSKFEPTSMRSRDSLKLEIGDIVYEAPSLKASIDQVTLSSRTQANVFGSDYTIESLRITSGPLFDLVVKGRYQMDSQQFAVDAGFPYLNLGEIGKNVSGEMVQVVNEMNPQGIISLSFKASGRVPQQSDLDQLTLPLQAETQVTLEDVEGAFAQHRLRGTRGRLSMSFLPGDHPVAKLTTDLKAEDIQLASGLPLKQISGALARVDVTSRDFDEITIDQVRLGMSAGEMITKGTVMGVKGLLTGQTSLGEFLGKLFAQVTTKVSVDLDEFHDLLVQEGVSSNGQVHVEVSSLKKEEGPLDVRLHLGARKVSLKKEGMKVSNADGGLSLRKQLIWNPHSQNVSLDQAFKPSDVLAQLRSLNGKGRRMAIDEVDIGLLKISNFSMNTFFDQNALRIQKLAMNVLGGGLGGNIVLQTDKTFGVSARIEAAKLDLNHLLEDRLKISGDSLVDATVNLSVFFQEKTGALDLGRTEIHLFLTHIGKEALDRLLVFLDPEGSNPILVSARSQVKLANPSKATIHLARGMMGLEILFSEGLISSFKMDRIPVGKIKNLQTITQGLPNWEIVTQIMAMVGAESYGVDEEGNVLIQ